MRNSINKYLKRNGFLCFEPKAVLFDMDGVLYNSMPNHAKAWRICLERHNLNITEEEAYLYEGMRGVETIKLLAQQQWGRTLTEEEAADIYREKTKVYSGFPTAELIKHVHELQASITNKGWDIGVVTGSGQKSLLERILKDFDGLVSPNILVSAKDVKHGKPAPEPYIKGMQKAGTQPWQTIVIENAPLGIRAAVAAKCFTIAVNTGPLPNSCLESEGADMILTSMTEVIEHIERTFPNDGDNLFY